MHVFSKTTENSYNVLQICISESYALCLSDLTRHNVEVIFTHVCKAMQVHVLQ